MNRSVGIGVVKAIRLRRQFAVIAICMVCAMLVAVGALRFVDRSAVRAQNVSLSDVAKRYPNFTKQQQMALLRERQTELHPRWQDLSFSEVAARVVRFLAPEAADSSVEPSLANFVGNLTGIGQAAGGALPQGGLLYLQRQSDCSLLSKTASYAITLSSPTFTKFQNTSTTPHYENVLHNAAQLSTKSDVFANGCVDPNLGIGSREGVYLGKTSQNLYMFAAAGYDNVHGTNGLYYGTLNADTNAVNSFNIDNSDPNISAVSAGDLNGDGLADVISVDNIGTSTASVAVRLAHPDGSLSGSTPYSLPGSVSEAAVVDDINGDGKADVVVATRDTNSKQEYISVLTGKGDGTLNAAISMDVATPPGFEISNLVTADLRNSGHKDLVTSNGLVLLNDGSGTFTVSAKSAFAPSTASSNYGPNLAAGDLNRDGKQDLVVNNGGEVSIYLGKGDATFTPGQSYALSDSVGYVTITDLDGDGNADVYVGIANGGFFGGDQFEIGQAYALMGNGNGTFRGASEAPFVYTGKNLIDLNNDKVLDGVGVNATLNGTSVSFTSYLGRGDGTFVAKSTLQVPPVTTNSAIPQTCTFNGIESFAFGDINGDGNADLVFMPIGNGAATCLAGYFIATGKGDDTFNTPTFTYWPTLIAGQPYYNETLGSVSTADINHDGKADLIYVYSVNSSQGTPTLYQGVAVQLSNGDGTFQAPKLTQASSSTAQSPPPAPSVAQIGDVNGDGYPDLFVLQGNAPVCTSQGCGPITNYQFELFLGKGDGTFGAPATMPADPNVPGGLVQPYSQVALADMNGDGHVDAIALSLITQGGVGIYLGRGDGTFSAPIDVDFGGQGLGIGDFDGDGKLDVAVTGPFNAGIFPGNGDGTLQSFTDGSGTLLPPQTIIFPTFGAAIATDLNGDGKSDLLSGSLVLLSQPANTTNPNPISTTTTLAASAITVTIGQSVTFTAKIAPSSGSGTATGTVTFYDGATSLGTGSLSSGSASFSTSSLAVGAHSITATYGGDGAYGSSTSSAVPLTVNAVPIVTATTTGLSASASSIAIGTNITFTAAVAPATGSGVPTGTVTFYDGTASLGTGTLSSGKATYATTGLNVGVHSITATYGGDANYGSSTSAAASITVTSASSDFSISLAQASGTVNAGSSATSTITITPIAGFNQQVSLTCSGAPKNTTCSISPAFVTPNGTTASTATMTMQTNVKTAMLRSPAIPGQTHGSSRTVSLAFLGGGLLSFALVRRHRRSWWYTQLGLAFLVLGASALVGCGSSGTSTPKGTSTLTVTATSGSTSHTATFTLTVK